MGHRCSYGPPLLILGVALRANLGSTLVANPLDQPEVAGRLLHKSSRLGVKLRGNFTDA